MTDDRAGRRRVVKPAAERRRELLDAALRLFHQRGFDETTVQDIADAAGVAAGTLYLYFRSKEHVLAAIHEDFELGQMARFQEAIEALFERAGGDEPVGVRAVVDTMWDTAMAHMLENRATVEVMCRYFPRLGLQEERRLDSAREGLLARLFRLGIDAGVVATEDPESTAYLLESINASVAKALAFGDPPDLERLVAQAKEIYYRALTPEPASG